MKNAQQGILPGRMQSGCSFGHINVGGGLDGIKLLLKQVLPAE
jgi:hypothetical protein